MLARPLSEIYENLRDYFVVRKGDKVIGCVALHVNWSDLAEIKALAVSEDAQGEGIGAQLVDACLEEARALELPIVFCLTYKPDFFAKQGFARVDKMKLPKRSGQNVSTARNSRTARRSPCSASSGRGPSLAEEKTLSSRYIFKGRAFNVRVDTVINAGGQETTREIVEHGECVAVVPVDAEGQILMVRQFRKSVEKELLEIPAGGIEPGEEPVAAVKRELQEEIGCLPGRVERMGGFYSTPATALNIYIFTWLRTLNPASSMRRTQPASKRYVLNPVISGD